MRSSWPTMGLDQYSMNSDMNRSLPKANFTSKRKQKQNSELDRYYETAKVKYKMVIVYNLNQKEGRTDGLEYYTYRFGVGI